MIDETKIQKKLTILIILLIAVNIYDILYHIFFDGYLNFHQTLEAVLIFFISGLMVWLKFLSKKEWMRFQTFIQERDFLVKTYKKKYKSSLLKIRKEIEEQFQAWGLTEEEKKLARYLLLGYSFKQISGVMNKSIKTLRNQSLSIYRKSGMLGRSDFVGYFFHDVFKSE
ncbi:MAG: hypothetical protein NZ853_08170 [Leptospiraceae bacterium]|nr:hypothetical protein [Leptospiraceae bacterium]MDW7976850.1 hypothetical protein [Leptospiraceae bacterium]